MWKSCPYEPRRKGLRRGPCKLEYFFVEMFEPSKDECFELPRGYWITQPSNITFISFPSHLPLTVIVCPLVSCEAALTWSSAKKH